MFGSCCIKIIIAYKKIIQIGVSDKKRKGLAPESKSIVFGRGDTGLNY